MAVSFYTIDSVLIQPFRLEKAPHSSRQFLVLHFSVRQIPVPSPVAPFSTFRKRPHSSIQASFGHTIAVLEHFLLISGTFQSNWTQFCYAQTPLARFVVLLYRLVADYRIVVDLLYICCTACRATRIAIDSGERPATTAPQPGVQQQDSVMLTTELTSSFPCVLFAFRRGILRGLRLVAALHRTGEYCRHVKCTDVKYSRDAAVREETCFSGCVSCYHSNAGWRLSAASRCPS